MNSSFEFLSFCAISNNKKFVNATAKSTYNYKQPKLFCEQKESQSGVPRFHNHSKMTVPAANAGGKKDKIGLEFSGLKGWDWP
jgi:hypothetical protein